MPAHPSTPEALALKRCFPPVVAADTRVLVLGSLPGEASLAAGQYYAYPHNQFWRLLGDVLGQDLVSLDYPARLQALLAQRIGLWDVVAEAKRRGSLDMAIRDARQNDLVDLLASLPALRLVAFNGKTAARAAVQLQGMALHCLELPSSSPANTQAYATKLQVWQQIDGWLRD